MSDKDPLADKSDAMFWLLLPFLFVFLCLFGALMLLHHFFWRHVLNKKGESLWEKVNSDKPWWNNGMMDRDWDDYV